MTAQMCSTVLADDAFADPTVAVAAARRYLGATALRPSATGRVGLELEFHLVDPSDPARRPDWDEVVAAAASLPAMPSGSSVTLEPGGQIELSTPPTADIVSSVAALRADREVLRTGLAAVGLAAVPLGTDPARPARRVNPGARYVAMERHFAALECDGPGAAMMTSTAALQVNLDAGPAAGWRERLDLIAALGPVLVALSAASPYLAGHASGWHSMRQEIWYGIDHGRSDPLAPDAEPAGAWATYALDAPLMLVHEGGGTRPVLDRVPFGAWLRGTADPAGVGRRPGPADLDYHLTTLFPPVRPRGYVEIRCIDALPDRWWPALAALTAVLIDDPDAAPEAAAAAAPAAGAWLEAARFGLADPAVDAAVRGCVRVALEHCPTELGAELGALADLVETGRTPGDELRARADAVGPLRLLAEEAHA